MHFRALLVSVTYFFAALCFIQSSFAAPRDLLCSANFAAIDTRLATNLPPVIRKSESVVLRGKILDVDELKPIVERTMASISDLPDGTYTYAVASDRRLAVMPRGVDPGVAKLPNPMTSPGIFLGSHEGLVRFLGGFNGSVRRARRKNVDLIAAGEFVVRDGRVLAVTNGAGTFKNGMEHLEFGAAELKAAGLPTDSHTQLLDYSKGEFADPHQRVIDQIRTEIAAARDPRFAAVLSDMRRVMRLIDRKFTDKTEFAKLAIARAQDGTEGNLRFKAMMFLARWGAPLDSEVMSLHSVYTNSSEAKVRAWMDALERAANEVPGN